MNAMNVSWFVTSSFLGAIFAFGFIFMFCRWAMQRAMRAIEQHHNGRCPVCSGEKAKVSGTDEKRAEDWLQSFKDMPDVKKPEDVEKIVKSLAKEFAEARIEHVTSRCPVPVPVLPFPHTMSPWMGSIVKEDGGLIILDADTRRVAVEAIQKESVS